MQHFGETHRLIPQTQLLLALTCSEKETYDYVYQALNKLFSIHSKDNYIIANAYRLAGLALLRFNKDLAKFLLFISYHLLSQTLPSQYRAGHVHLREILTHIPESECAVYKNRMEQRTEKENREHILKVLRELVTPQQTSAFSLSSCVFFAPTSRELLYFAAGSTVTLLAVHCFSKKS